MNARNMQKNQNESFEVDCKKLLIDFYSSELNAKSRLVVGFAVMLLTMMSIKLGISMECAQTVVFYFMMWFPAFGLLYQLVRALGYGQLANAALHVKTSDLKKDFLEEMLKQLLESARNNYLLVKWFISSKGRRLWSGRILLGVLAAFGIVIIWFLIR